MMKITGLSHLFKWENLSEIMDCILERELCDKRTEFDLLTSCERCIFAEQSVYTLTIMCSLTEKKLTQP